MTSESYEHTSPGSLLLFLSAREIPKAPLLQGVLSACQCGCCCWWLWEKEGHTLLSVAGASLSSVLGEPLQVVFGGLHVALDQNLGLLHTEHELQSFDSSSRSPYWGVYFFFIKILI